MAKRFGRSIVLVSILLTGSSSFGQFHQDPGDGTGSGSGSCGYCSQSRCGCAPAPLGYVLYYECSCSSIQCTRSCDYYPR
jgi:hypothetical protein